MNIGLDRYGVLITTEFDFDHILVFSLESLSSTNIKDCQNQLFNKNTEHIRFLDNLHTGYNISIEQRWPFGQNLYSNCETAASYIVYLESWIYKNKPFMQKLYANLKEKENQHLTKEDILMLVLSSFDIQTYDQEIVSILERANCSISS